jgi:hypothetical protein
MKNKRIHAGYFVKGSKGFVPGGQVKEIPATIKISRRKPLI